MGTYVRTYVRMFVMYVPTYIRTYIRTYVHTYVRMYVRTYVRMLCTNVLTLEDVSKRIQKVLDMRSQESYRYNGGVSKTYAKRIRTYPKKLYPALLGKYPN